MPTAHSEPSENSLHLPHRGLMLRATRICLVTVVLAVANGCTHESDRADHDEAQQVQITHVIDERHDSQEPDVAAVVDEAEESHIIEALFGGDDNLQAADLVYVSTVTTVPSEHRKLGNILVRHGEQSKEFDLAFRNSRLSTSRFSYSVVIAYLRANLTPARLTTEFVSPSNCKLADASVLVHCEMEFRPVVVSE